MDHCKPSRTPADFNLRLHTAQNEDKEVDQRVYRSFVGSLLYLAKQTRPEIMFSQHSVQTECTYQSALAVWKTTSAYLQGSYTKEASYALVGESDADWSDDVNDKKLKTGYYFKLNGRGAALN